MKVILIASALGLLLLAAACSPHRGYYGGGHCGPYWNGARSYDAQPGASGTPAGMNPPTSSYGY